MSGTWWAAADALQTSRAARNVILRGHSHTGVHLISALELSKDPGPPQGVAKGLQKKPTLKIYSLMNRQLKFRL